MSEVKQPNEIPLARIKARREMLNRGRAKLLQSEAQIYGPREVSQVLDERRQAVRDLRILQELA